MSASFLSRVTKYAAGGIDQRENRLTEITAAVLETVDGAAEVFARELLKAAAATDPKAQSVYAHLASLPKTTVEISTQRFIGDGFVDLILEFSADVPDLAVEVWVEVKHGAGTHGDQLERYVAAASSSASNAVVVMLAPRSSAPESPTVATALWPSVGSALARFLHLVSAPEQRWLLDEYLNYLREQRLMDPNALNSAHALAFEQLSEATAAAEAIVNAAAPRIERAWTARGLKATERSMPSGQSPRAFAAFAAMEGSTAWTTGFPEWGWHPTRSFESWDGIPAASWAFYAGVSFGAKNLVRDDRERGETLRKLQSDLHLEWLYFGGRYRLVRLLYPAQLLREPDLDGQVEVLTEWADDAIAALLTDA